MNPAQRYAAFVADHSKLVVVAVLLATVVVGSGATAVDGGLSIAGFSSDTPEAAAYDEIQQNFSTEGENTTIQGTQYFAHFPDDSSVRILPTDERYSDYKASLDRAEDYDQRVIGFWGIVDLSIVAVIVLVATALLPVRG